MRENQESYRLILVTALTATQVLHETLDELEETKFYKHNLKRVTKQMQKELSKAFDKEIDLVWSADEVSARQIQTGIEEISKAIAISTPGQIAMIGEMLKEKKL